jgi:hypothetical protein
LLLELPSWILIAVVKAPTERPCGLRQRSSRGPRCLPGPAKNPILERYREPFGNGDGEGIGGCWQRRDLALLFLGPAVLACAGLHATQREDLDTWWTPNPAGQRHRVMFR